jgi:hypothetical protein
MYGGTSHRTLPAKSQTQKRPTHEVLRYSSVPCKKWTCAKNLKNLRNLKNQKNSDLGHASTEEINFSNFQIFKFRRNQVEGGKDKGAFSRLTSCAYHA